MVNSFNSASYTTLSWTAEAILVISGGLKTLSVFLHRTSASLNLHKISASLNLHKTTKSVFVQE